MVKNFVLVTSIPWSKLWNRKGEGILVLLNAARIKMCNAFDHQVGWFLFEGSRTMSLLFPGWKHTLTWKNAAIGPPGHSEQSHYLGCGFWVWMLKFKREEDFLELTSRCGWCPQVWWPPEDLRGVLHQKSSLFSMMWWAKIVHWTCFFLWAWNPGNWDSTSPPSTTIALAWCFDLSRMMQRFFSPLKKVAADRTDVDTALAEGSARQMSNVFEVLMLMLIMISRHLERYRGDCKDFAEFSCLSTWHGIPLWICTLGQSQLRN